MKKMKNDTDCVRNDDLFANRVKSLAAKMENCQLEIGKLVHLYIQEHGNKYGDGVFSHIAEITNLSIRSIRHYRDFYCLQVEYADSANLPNLCKSVRYEIARLIETPNAKTLIPQVAQKADEGSMLTEDVEKEVSALLKDADRLGKKKPVKPEAADKAKESPALSSEEEEILRQATGILELGAKQDTKIAVRMAEHQRVMTSLCHHLLAYLSRLVEMGEGDNFSPIVKRMAKELIELNQTIENGKSRQAPQGEKAA